MSQTAWPRAILHMDMDAFYVNVHLLDHPEDAGRPLVVGGRPEQRGVVSSASYEARRFGVRSAMTTAQALRLVPQLKIVSPDWPRIKTCSRQVMEILEPFGPLEQISVDEAFIDFSRHADPEVQAQAVWDGVLASTSLPASIGLATSKLVAKVASDFQKPRGFTVVSPGEEATFLAPLPVRVIWGIGPRTAERLAGLGITTCGELAAADPLVLRPIAGREAENLVRRAAGIDPRAVVAERAPAKSISQEWTFSRDVADPQVLVERLQAMAEEVARALQARNLVAHTIRVKFRWADFTTFTRQRSISVPTDEAATLYRHALSLWQDNWPPGQPVRLLGVGAGGLVEGEERQLGLGF
jgi:DNA polymerase IV